MINSPPAFSTKDLARVSDTLDMNWKMRIRKKIQKTLEPREQLLELQGSNRFLGVQIHQCGCRASSRLAGKVFSFKKAPSLPVEGCEASECHCQYMGVTDRRRGNDRRRLLFLVQENPKRKKNSRLRKRVERRKGKDVWKGFDNN